MSKKVVKSESKELAVVSYAEMPYDKLLKELPKVIMAKEEELKFLQGDMSDKDISLKIEYNNTAISDIDSVAELTAIEASIEARCAAYTEVLVRRNLTDKVVEWSEEGKNIEHWRKVLNKAFNTLLNKSQITQLENQIKVFKESLPKEQKLYNNLLNLLEDSNKKLS